MRYTLLFLLFAFISYGQDCTVCPAGSSVQLTSSFPTATSWEWTCTDGFTSSLENPTFTPAADVTCSLLVTDSGGCTATDEVIVDVCECGCNDNMCVDISYDSSTECVTLNEIGTPCSPVTADIIEWRNIDGGSWTQIPAGSTLCDCDIRERVNTTASVSVVSGNFRLQIDGLQNRCNPCTGSNMQINFVFGISGYNTTLFPGCAGTTDWRTISEADFANAGYVADAYVRYSTPWGIVVNLYRFSYNGNGLSASNVTVQEVYKKSIYKTIEARRTINFSDGCPQAICETELAIPQQPNDPCTHFVAYVTNVNLGSPCNGAGLSGATINGTAPLTYQWKYNGVDIAGETTQWLCIVGRANGTYCVEISDAAGCNADVCVVVQPACNLNVNITESGGTLSSTVSGCNGTRTNNWERWNGTSWVSVGTGTSYNTNGVGGQYRLTVTCTGPPICTTIANYVYTPPCTADVSLTLTNSTTLTATVTNCGGANITYTWQRWTGTAWTSVRTFTTTSTTDTYNPTVDGLYRVTIVCGNCTDQAQINYIAPNPCTGYSVSITGPANPLCANQVYNFNRTITGGTGPYSTEWFVNGISVSTNDQVSLSYTVGIRTLSVTVVDANNCSFTASRSIQMVNCCAVTVSLTPTSVSRCENQSATFTASQTGGTLPVNYVWSSQLGANPPVNQGTGTTKDLSFATAGTYTVSVTGTDNTGCQSTATSTFTVTNCTNCNCTPGLTLSGCQLTGTFTGLGCPNFTYQLQYSLSGTGWSTVSSGTASSGGSFNHTPTSNGFYRLVINGTPSGCGTFTTTDVSVQCVVTCGCTGRSLTYDAGTCELSWTAPCTGYTSDLERYNGTSWVFVAQNSPYTPSENGDYRVVYRKGGCPDVISNTVTVNQNSCPNQFQYYDSDLDFNVHHPFAQELVSLNKNAINLTPENLISFRYSNCFSPFTSYNLDYDDGSNSNLNSASGSITHQYNTTGEYYSNLSSTNAGRTSTQDMWVNVNNCFNEDCEAAFVRPACGDGLRPILYDFSGCDDIEVLIFYQFDWQNLTNPTYTSHYVKINNVNYTVAIDQSSPGGWLISNVDYNTNTATPIILPYSTNYYEIEVGVTFNTNKTVVSKGFFKLCE